MSRRALIGYTGFVGSNLMAQAPFDDGYNSKNIEELAGKHYELIVCAGAPAVKWKANKEPEADRAAIARLEGALGAATADRVILISTVDVYPRPIETDEATPLDPAAGEPYGKHRLMLERTVEARFKTTTIRLPGLFGPGLKKNIIFDFLHQNAVAQINAESVFQFYDLTRLWRDIGTVEAAGVRRANFATEPVSVGEVAREAFGFAFTQTPGNRARYDFRTLHAGLFGKSGGYMMSKREVLDALARFVAEERKKLG